MTDTQACRTQDTLSRLYDDPDERIDELRTLKPSDGAIEHQREIFQALGNEDRLRLLAALRDGEKCVCELQVILDAPQSTVATHLATLREAGLAKRRRKGKWSYYRMADGAVLDLLNLADVLAGER